MWCTTPVLVSGSAEREGALASQGAPAAATRLRCVRPHRRAALFPCFGLLVTLGACDKEPVVPVPPSPEPPLLAYVAPRDTVVRPSDSVRYAVLNTEVPASEWRWSVSDGAIVTIDSLSGVAVARAPGQTGIRAVTATRTVTATTSVTVRQ